MNTRENNEKNIKKLEQTNPVFNDGAKKTDIDNHEADTSVPESPLAFARKLTVGVMIIFWAAALVMMIGGGDFRAMMPFLLFSVAAVALLNIPAFFAKKKYMDMVIAGVAGTVLLVTGLSMMLVR